MPQQHKKTITIAVPKGRLSKRVFEYFAAHGIRCAVSERSLIVHNKAHGLKILLVKNMDLPEYVHSGTADIGIAGSDVLYESPHAFFSLGVFPFGSTKICLIAAPGTPPIDTPTRTKVATKYVRYTRAFLSARGIQASVIPLHGSVELAPMLGLSPYIVDLVETGRTIQENNLTVAEEIGKTSVVCFANKALYKLNHKAIDDFIRQLKL